MSNQVLNYIEKKGFPYRRRGDELMMNCPFCPDGDKERKFAINVITGAFNCLHLNGCGVRGSFWDLQKKLGDNPEKLNSPRTFVNNKKKTYKLPEKEVVEIEGKSIAVDQIPVFEYLQGRGFTAETIKHFHIGAKANTVMLPFYKNGKLANIKYRDIVEKHKMYQEKDAEPLLFNRDNVQGHEIIICEGEYDAMALHQYGIEAVSVPNGATGMQWVEGEWEFLETFKKIYLCFDSDSAGREGAITLAGKLGMWRCVIVTLPYKDANECLKKGTPLDDIKQCFENAMELTPESIVSPVFFGEKIKKIFAAGASLFGTATAWDMLTDILKGWRGGEVSIITGRNGSGKSTFLNQSLLDLAKRGERTCIYSGEMPPERYLRWALVQMAEKDHLDSTEVDIYLEWMNGRVYIINTVGSVEPVKLLEDFEYAARRYDCKHFVIDSLMKVNLDLSDEYNEQKRFVSSLCDFTKKFNVHAHLVAHPRKTMSDSDEPGKVDVKGNSNITDLADNVIVLFRTEADKIEKARSQGKDVADTVVYVKKNREFGIEGRVQMYFNTVSKKFFT